MNAYSPAEGTTLQHPHPKPGTYKMDVKAVLYVPDIHMSAAERVLTVFTLPLTITVKEGSEHFLIETSTHIRGAGSMEWAEAATHEKNAVRVESETTVVPAAPKKPKSSWWGRFWNGIDS